MQSKASTPNQYLKDLLADRAKQIQAVRKVILENLPEGYEEVMNWGMITYQVPLSIYSDTYNKQPLMYAALASQKNYMAVYLSGIYMFEDKRLSFEQAYRATGKRFDAGKSCVRFRNLDHLPLELIAETIASLSMTDFVTHVKAVHASGKTRSSKA